MEMDYLLSLFDTPQGKMWLNLALCLVGLVWTWGVDPKVKEPDAWQAWLGFWAGTGVFYLLMVSFPTAPYWLASLGLSFLILDMND